MQNNQLARRPKIFFLHLSKTAGTSFSLALDRIAAPRWTFGKWTDLRDASEAHLARHNLITGHCYAFQMERPFFKDFLKVTVLRNPLERFVSAYNFSKWSVEQNANAPSYMHFATRVSMFEYFMSHPGFNERHQQLFLLGLADNEPAAEVPLEVLRNRAEQRLQDMVVAVTPQLGAVAAGLRMLFGLEPDSDMPIANVTPERHKVSGVAEEEIALMRRVLAEDFALYDVARERCEAFIADPQFPSRELAKQPRAFKRSYPRIKEKPQRCMTQQSKDVGVEATTWAIRLLAGREPRDENEIAVRRRHASMESLRKGFVRNWEFAEFYAHLGERPPRYAMPVALMRPPEDVAVPWRFAEPTIQEPVSQICTASQFAEAAYARWCQALREQPQESRRQWQFVWHLACIDRAGLLRSGCRALGFGVGREPMPSVLAAQGVAVVGSDAPAGRAQGGDWENSPKRIDDMYRSDIVDRETFDRLVTFREVDMNAIPHDLRGFDICWSTCALEHLGSLKHGLDFIENSLATLKPGALAVHTTEFNLSSDRETFETARLSYYRRSDLLGLASRLVAQGHEVWPMNMHPGTTERDEVVAKRGQLPMIKLIDNDGFLVTCVGFAVRRRSD